jgi:ElaA protein
MQIMKTMTDVITKSKHIFPNSRHNRTGENHFEQAEFAAMTTGDLISPSDVEWVWSGFEGLTPDQLYGLLKLRESIFIVEQNVPYVDMDGKDKYCRHLMGSAGNEIVAYMRVVPLDLFAPGFFSLGRVVVRADLRGTGIGREMMLRGIDYLDKIREGSPIKISSQLYLKKFYASFGFVPQGEPYIEDRIPHIAMVRAD